MTEEKIIIRINEETGELFIETKGILGPSCVTTVNKLIENSAVAFDYQKTDEYYMEGHISATTKQTQRINV